MASLSGVSVASSYTSLLKLNGNTDTLVDGDGSNARQIVDGDGTTSPLFLNTDRLGIGGQPSEIFHSKGTNAGASLTLAMLENATSDANSEARLFFVSGGNSTRGSYISSINTSASGQPADLVFATSSAYAAPTEAMRIDSSQNVLIGNASSTGKFQITGPVYNGAIDVDQFKAITMMIDGDSYWAQKAQLKLGRWENASGSHARSSLQIALSHANVADDADADVNVMTLLSSGSVGIGTESPAEFVEVEKDQNARQAQFLASHVELSNANVLEIGAHFGSFLEHLHDEFKCIAYFDELSDEALRVLSSNEKLAYRHSAEAPKQFDGLILRHVLEHIFDAKSFLKSLHSLVEDRGWLFIEVPDWSHLDKYTDPFIFEHLSQFNTTGLTNLLSHCGWQLEALEKSINENDPATPNRVQRIIVKRSKLPLPGDQKIVTHFNKFADLHLVGWFNELNALSLQ